MGGSDAPVPVMTGGLGTSHDWPPSPTGTQSDWVTSRDAPVPVPDWVTGYQSDRSPSPDWVPSPTRYPVRLGNRSDWVSLTSKYINSF